MEDFYQILGVKKDASQDEIKRRYRKLANQTHPDKAGGDAELFKKISVAYDTLSDPVKKAKYDAPPEETFNPFQYQRGHSTGNQQFDDIINQMFRQSGGFSFDADGRGRPRKNRDIQIRVVVDLASTLSDQKKTFSLPLSEKTVDITVPRGVADGTTVRYPGLGDTLFANLPAGDLLVAYSVVTPDRFTVSGKDLLCAVDVDCLSAITGDSVTVMGLDGKLFTVAIRPGTQHGTKLRIKEQGLYSVHGGEHRGNLIIVVNIVVPVVTDANILDMINSLKVINNAKTES